MFVGLGSKRDSDFVLTLVFAGLMNPRIEPSEYIKIWLYLKQI